MTALACTRSPLNRSTLLHSSRAYLVDHKRPQANKLRKGAAPTAKPTSTYSAVVLTDYTEIDACGSYVGPLLCHQPPTAVGGYQTRRRLRLLEHVRGRDRLHRPNSEPVASAVL